MSTHAGAGLGPAEYLVVYYERESTSAWWTRWVDDAFAHVEVWWHLGEGYWVALRPNHSHVTCDIMVGAPVPGENRATAVQSVRCERSAQTPMRPFGMKTCVSIVKAVLGVRSARVQTPKQLYDYITKRGYVIP